jgi:multiple sugar transport system substrate-binding protein
MTAQLSKRRAMAKLALTAAIVSAVASVAALQPQPARAETKLTYWTPNPEYLPFMKSAAEAYQKTHPDVQFDFLGASAREMEQKLSTAVPTGTGPDAFDIGTNISVNFIDGGLLNPNPPAIDQYLKSAAWNAAMVDYLTRNGKTYGLPLVQSNAAMYYNKAMFREAGISDPPSTFAELLADARKLVAFDSTGKMTRSGISLRLSGQGSGVAEKFWYVLGPAGGSILAQTPNGKWHNGYDNDAGRAALQFYLDAVYKSKVDDPKFQHDADAFVAGKTAMLFRESWVIGDLQDKNPGLEYGVAPIPRWNAADPYKRFLQIFPVYVNGSSKSRDVAWDFVQFITSRDNGLKMTSTAGWLSARQDIDWAPLLQKTPQFGGFLVPPKNNVYFLEPILPVWDELESKMADKLVKAYADPSMADNPAKISEALHQMATETDQILKDSDLYAAQ